MAIDYEEGRRVINLRPEVAWETIKDLAQYEEEKWNDPIFSEKVSPDYINATLEQELECMECQVDSLMRNEMLLGYEEDQVRQLEEQKTWLYLMRRSLGVHRSFIGQLLDDDLANAFEWSEEASKPFLDLKQAMSQTPVLALPDFQKTFVVETYASGVGIGVVLQQEGHPISYLSITLAPKHQSLSTYEKEFLAVLMALEK
ncbi:retrovirus-related pol polyprotein from transposon 17.6 [Tanacetum coccineum]